MTLPGADVMLAGIQRWVALESKSDETANVTAMMEHAMADYRDAGLRVEAIAGRDGYAPHFMASTQWGEGRSRRSGPLPPRYRPSDRHNRAQPDPG